MEVDKLLMESLPVLISSPGLKAQHVACIRCLAGATAAKTANVFIGSKSFEFTPTLSPASILNRNIIVKAESAASTLLVFQSILPFLMFAGDENSSPVTVTIYGGTNVSFSLSFEYLDQVLLPALERFGVHIERKLENRGWSHGSMQLGCAKFKLIPLSPGKIIRAPNWPLEQGKITKIDITIVVPDDLQKPLKDTFLFEINLVFPDVKANFLLVEDSRHKARVYSLLVAHTSTGLRFGRDWLYDRTTKNKTPDEIAVAVARKCVDDLDAEIRKGGVVDEYLQDQLVVFQALAQGQSSLPGSAAALGLGKNRIDRTDQPFGDGSLHTTTARWVTNHLLPGAKWIDEGRICEGVAWKTPPVSVE